MIRDKHKGKSKGFGFVSFMDPFEGLKGGCVPLRACESGPIPILPDGGPGWGNHIMIYIPTHLHTPLLYT